MELQQFDFYSKTLFHREHAGLVLDGKHPAPINVEIDPTNACNHRCTFCQWADYIARDRATLKASVVDRLLQDLAALGVRSITWTGGGEPTLHTHFWSFLEQAHALGLANGLLTNGTRLDPSKDEMIHSRLRFVRISMAGGDRNSYALVQGRDDFELVLGNVLRIARQRPVSSHLDIGVALVVKPCNFGSLDAFADTLAGAGVTYLQLRQDMFSTQADQQWWKDFVVPHAEKLKDRMNKTCLKVLGASYMEAQAHVAYPRKCYAHGFVTAVSATGDVSFCKNTRGNAEFRIGNLYQATFREIWTGSAAKRTLEDSVSPSCCATFCKNMEINRAVEDLSRRTVASYPSLTPPAHQEFF